VATVTGLSNPTLYNFLSVALSLGSRRRNLGELGNRSSISLDYLYKSVHGIASLFERVDLFRPMRRSAHFKHNDPCSCAYLNYPFGFMSNTCSSSITEDIDDMSAGQNLITLSNVGLEVAT
jgi:hypothetical protein